MSRRPPPPPPCTLCGGSKCLTQRGIAVAYVRPLSWAVIVMILGLVLAFARSRHWLWLTALGYVMPLAMADLRLLLYPVVALGALAGRRPNCPRCEPSGAIWRH